MKREVKFLSAQDCNASDTSGYDKFKDVSLTALVPVVIGEYDVPAGVVKATWGGGKTFVVLYDDTTTAVREEGTFVFNVQGPSGDTAEVFRFTSYEVGANGQGSTPSEWKVLPEGGKYTIGGGKLQLVFISTASDILDTTDNLWYSLPCVIYT